MRADGRQPDELRPVRFTRHFNKYAEGSVLIEVGDTKVICAASVEEGVPPFRRDSGEGWLTAEYAMLPRSTGTRSPRESARGRIGGRTHEIQRLIGRSLRAVVDFQMLGQRTVWIDCDVIQADGDADGIDHREFYRCFRCPRASACARHYSSGSPVGFCGGDERRDRRRTTLLDLSYQEDSACEVDMNVVMTGAGRFIEVQGTAEHQPFGREALDQLLDLATHGVDQLIALQRSLIGEDRLAPHAPRRDHEPGKARRDPENLVGA